MTPSPVALWLDRGLPRPGFILVCGFISASICVGFLLLFGDMGQGKSTPLSATLDHWKEVRGRGFDLSVNVKKRVPGRLSVLPSGPLSVLIGQSMVLLI